MVALLVLIIVLFVVFGVALVLNVSLLRRATDDIREKNERFFKACDALVAFTAELSKVTNDVLNNKR